MRANDILIVAASTFLLSCATMRPGGATVEGCLNDMQCKGERVCESKQCTNPVSPMVVDTTVVELDKDQEKKSEKTAKPPDKAADPVACERGNAVECYNLGMAKAFGVGVSKDEGDARAYFQKACRAGHIFGCINLLFLLEKKNGAKNGGAKSEYLRVQDINEYKKSCGRGDAEACFVTARFLDHTLLDEIEKDLNTAREYYAKACEKEHILSCASAARMWSDGLGGRQNKIKAKSYFEKACKGDHAQSCAALGRMWSAGTGGPRDAAKAKEYFNRACDLGESESCANLKRMK
jgi:TPR repeat protein